MNRSVEVVLVLCYCGRKVFVEGGGDSVVAKKFKSSVCGRNVVFNWTLIKG